MSFEFAFIVWFVGTTLFTGILIFGIPAIQNRKEK